MKKLSLKAIIFLAILGVAMNCYGRFLSVSLGLPVMLNLIGSVASAYFGGPVIGGIVTAASCGICSFYMHDDIYYLVPAVVIVILTGLIARSRKYLNKWLSFIGAVTQLSIIYGVFIYAVDMLFLNGFTTMDMPNLVIPALNAMGISVPWANSVAAMYLAFLDMLAANLLVFLEMVFAVVYKKRIKASELKKSLYGTKMLLVLIFAGALCLGCFGSKEVKAETGIDFVQKVYDGTNGLTGGTVNDMTQGSDGAIWLATYGGLYRFTGYTFSRVTHVDNVRSCLCVYTDSKDRLWVGTNGSGVTVFENATDCVTADTDTGMPSNYITSVLEDEEGAYWIGTTSGLVKAEYDGTEITVEKTYDYMGNITDITSDSNGYIAVVNASGEVRILKNSMEIPAPDEAEDYYITEATFEEGGKLFLGTRFGKVLVFENGENAFPLLDVIDAEGLSNIKEIYFDDTGYAYLASDKGIGCFNSDGVFSKINTGTFSGNVNHIYKDYQGNLWFTSSKCGLLKMEKSAFTNLYMVCNAKDAVVNVAQEYGDYIYTGTDDGLVILDINNRTTVENDLTDYLKGDRIRDMAISPEGKLLIAANENGIIEVSKKGKFSSYLKEDEDAGKGARVIYTVSDGHIFLSTTEGLLTLYDHAVDKVLKLDGEKQGSEVYNVLELSDGSVLAGTNGGGMFLFKNGGIEGYITADLGFPTGVILRVVEDKWGDGYFVLTACGLCYMDEDYNIREIENVPYYSNYDLVEGPNNKVFILGGAGIYVIDYGELIFGANEDSFELLDSSAGIQGSITDNAWNYVDDDEILYFCGSSGLYSLDLNNYKTETTKYYAELVSVTANGEEQIILNDTDVIDVDAGANIIELSLGLNSFGSAEPMVRYYMSGVDSEKTTVSASDMEDIRYEGLPYGQHEFHIEVLNDDGELVSERTYTFYKELEDFEKPGFRTYFITIFVVFNAFLALCVINIGSSLLNRRRFSEHESTVQRLEREKTKALETALRAEESANRTKSAFLANMSHEIRTPINAIIGMDTMIMRESSQSRIRDYAVNIHTAGNTLLSLINDILDFSKIESGKMELAPAEYEVGPLINNLVNMVEPKAKAKNLDLIMDIDPHIPKRLYGDDVRTEQIILNILNNAVKYTEEGSITFSMRHEKISTGDVILSVSITDTGIGMKQEDIGKLFSPYERIEESRNKKIEGTGLGMSITKSLLKQMDSTLEVTSEYGKGSTFAFSITVPVVSDEEIGDYRQYSSASDIDPSAKEAFHAPDAEILVVDDVEMNLMVAVGLLKRVRVKVDTASGGREALKMTAKKKYDIIFLDSMMPDMTGDETMHEIRRNSSLNLSTPIIVLTADAVKGAREEYLRMGYSDYLSKPIEVSKIEGMLQTYLPPGKIIPVDRMSTDDFIANAQPDDEDAGVFGGIIDFGEPDAPSEEPKPDYSGYPVIEGLSLIEEIDTDKAVTQAGGCELYESICKNFRDTAVSRIEMLRGYYESRDIENYTIQVHALKSTARLIGAFKFSDAALKLEEAGRANDMDTIDAGTDYILAEYARLYKAFDTVISGGGDGDVAAEDAPDEREEIEKDDLLGALSDMKELLEAFDFDTAKELFDEISEYRMPEDFTRIYEILRNAMAEVDRDSVIEAIDEYLSQGE